jgi:cytochrome c5
MKPTSVLSLAALALLCACQDRLAQRTPTEPEAAAASPAGPSASAAAAPTGNTVCDTYTDQLASLRAESAPDAEEVAAYEALAADACDN